MAEQEPVLQVNSYLVAMALIEMIQSQNKLNQMIAEHITATDHHFQALLQVLIDKDALQVEDIRTISKIQASRAAKADQVLAAHRQQALDVQNAVHPALSKLVEIMKKISDQQQGPAANAIT